jgi:hypothetical protein
MAMVMPISSYCTWIKALGGPKFMRQPPAAWVLHDIYCHKHRRGV